MEKACFTFLDNEQSGTAKSVSKKYFEMYQAEQDAPDEVEAEAQWIADKKRLYKALAVLTPRQRRIYILYIGYKQTEVKIAKLLKLNQSTVSRQISAAEKKLEKYLAK